MRTKTSATVCEAFFIGNKPYCVELLLRVNGRWVPPRTNCPPGEGHPGECPDIEIEEIDIFADCPGHSTRVTHEKVLKKAEKIVDKLDVDELAQNSLEQDHDSYLADQADAMIEERAQRECEGGWDGPW